jgi:hypothetical protein
LIFESKYEQDEEQTAQESDFEQIPVFYEQRNSSIRPVGFEKIEEKNPDE